jgi:hypothetical protein
LANAIFGSKKNLPNKAKHLAYANCGQKVVLMKELAKKLN